jgi:hypothetical protein
MPSSKQYVSLNYKKLSFHANLVLYFKSKISYYWVFKLLKAEHTEKFVQEYICILVFIPPKD